MTQALENNPYVVVVALDFSKTFDTVRHSSAMAEVVQLQLPDCVYNWLANFLDGHSHCMQFNTSDLLDVNAGFVQGSAIDPCMYVVDAWDLQVVTPGNSLVKYAVDTYLVIRGQSRERNLQCRGVAAGQQPHVKPCEISRGHFPRQPLPLLPVLPQLQCSNNRIKNYNNSRPVVVQ